MPVKAIAILGPTASGKSALALRLAQYIDGEIISADSRQIYRGMDIGTGKEPGRRLGIADTDPPLKSEVQKEVWMCEGIPHWMIDILDPSENYSVSQYCESADRIREEIATRNRIPIVCGGTGFWIQALVENERYPSVPPNPKLREVLRHYSAKDLFNRLERIDPERALTIDRANPVRLIRAIEIADTLGKVPPIRKSESPIDWIVFSTEVTRERLYEKIEKRLDERFASGMIDEVQGLHDRGIPWGRLESFGLEYRWISRYLKKEIDRDEMRESLFRDIRHYAKRQMTWIERWKKHGRVIVPIESYEKLSAQVASLIGSK